jgi:hypothetical protein
MLMAPHQFICMPISTRIPESAQSALAAQKPETAAPLNSMGCWNLIREMAIPVATKPSKASFVGFEGGPTACLVHRTALGDKRRLRLLASSASRHTVSQSEQQSLIVLVHPAEQFGESA